MNPPTRIELQIKKGAKAALKSYVQLTNYWLWHAPEYYITTTVANELGKLGYSVYIDASYNKLKNEIGKGRGKPLARATQRPDISVFAKSESNLNAIIEIKKAWNSDGIVKDSEKIRSYQKTKNKAKSAYILVYSEAQASKKFGMDQAEVIERRFDKWANAIAARKVWSVHNTAPKETWEWGFCLYKL
jgi:hypothetical protein